MTDTTLRMFDVEPVPVHKAERVPKAQAPERPPAACSCGLVGTPANPITKGITNKWFCQSCHEFVAALCDRSRAEAERMHTR